ncbi:kinase-like domain-containing protein [Rhizophagus clarus]|uniref:Kinase-like domain-containing protein n=1 Tax=Rhizophagus clarus TaxID=94130 RepID=A0A8H3MER8_9GLOM|nr:kinase-like domain-containing protein [Rhizophagus clarus]
MDEIKLSDDVIEQIKDFFHDDLTEEQNSLIDKLISNEKLKERYKEYDLCHECNQINTGHDYCRSCKSKYFQQNFKNWTSGNHKVDEFIQKAQLEAEHYVKIIEWIEYDKFEDIEYLAKGGFSTTYKAIWKNGNIHSIKRNGQLRRTGEVKVALKCLHNSQEITADFLKEVESNILACDPTSSFVVCCFGITKDPKTNNFMMVMKLKECSLRQHLNINFNSLNWGNKISLLEDISHGLKDIHNSELIHHDFHCGNLLNDSGLAYVTDLGLCQPANVKSSQNDKKEIYGVLPYVDPEVLRGKEYTQESDIYGFGIIAYEICTGLPPYHDIPHDEFLAMKICNGLRPRSDYKIPQFIFDIINQCWDAVPSKRPKAVELYSLFIDLYGDYCRGDFTIWKQAKEADEINKKSLSSTVQPALSSTGALSYTTHPQAVYTSRLLDFKNLPEPKNAENNDDLFEKEYSESLRINFTNLDINSKDKTN